MRIGYPYFKKVQKLLDSVNSVIREYLSGVRVIKAFNSFKYEEKRFKNANENLVKASIKAIRVAAIFTPIITLVVNLGIVAVLWFGGISVNNGNIEVGKIIALINYMTQILFSVMRISMVFNMFVIARASNERIDEVFKKENKMINSDNNKFLNDNGRVDFENVYFSYSDDLTQAVLKDITFTCMPGETIGIIGSTGAGKSSLVNLIPRFYDVKKGIVKVNGVNVKDISLHTLREKIAIVPQKTILFSGTILDNIKWGKDNASYDEVKKASSISQSHEFIIDMK